MNYRRRLRKKRTVIGVTLIPRSEESLTDLDVEAIYGRPSTRREMVTERVGDRPEDIRGRFPEDAHTASNAWCYSRAVPI